MIYKLRRKIYETFSKTPLLINRELYVLDKFVFAISRSIHLTDCCSKKYIMA